MGIARVEGTRLAEDSDAVRAFERSLAADVGRVADAVAGYEATCTASGIAPFRGASLPLRPLLFPARAVRAVVDGLKAVVAHARGPLLDHLLAEPAAFAVSRTVVEAARTATIARSHRAWSFLRPDGFWHADHFVLTELNVGMSTSVTVAETEILHALHACLHPERAPAQARPLPALLSQVRARAARPRVVVVPTREGIGTHSDFVSYAGQITWFLDAIERETGARVVLTSLRDDPEGPLRAVHAHDGVVLQAFYDEPRHPTVRALYEPLFADDLVLSRWLLPITTSLFEKNVLPALSDRFTTGAVRVPRTRLLGVFEEAPDDRDAWVLKSATNEKGVTLGHLVDDDVWRDRVQVASVRGGHVLQARAELPRVDLPVLVDGRLERVSMHVEVSPFIAEGAWAGAFARLVPVTSPAIVSPPPPDLALTVAWVV